MPKAVLLLWRCGVAGTASPNALEAVPIATLRNPNSIAKHSVARTASGTLYGLSPADVLTQPGGASGKIAWKPSGIWTGPKLGLSKSWSFECLQRVFLSPLEVIL